MAELETQFSVCSEKHGKAIGQSTLEVKCLIFTPTAVILNCTLHLLSWDNSKVYHIYKNTIMAIYSLI